MTTSIETFTSLRNILPNSNSTERPDLIEELYLSTKSYMPDEDANRFQTPSGIWQGGKESPNLFNFFLDYALRTYKQTKKKQRYCFPSWGQRNEEVWADMLMT